MTKEKNQELSFSPEALIAAACEKTGLTDFGLPDVLTPLEALTTSAEKDGKLSPGGRQMAINTMMRYLQNRLYAQSFFKKHPEILNLKVESPVIITGLYRSGTTKLHRMIAMDPMWHVLKMWQGLYPAPLPGTKAGEVDPRIVITEKSDQKLERNAPDFFAAHLMKAHEPEEEHMLLSHSLLAICHNPYVPGFEVWRRGQDYTPAYELMRDLLKLLQWQAGEGPARRWILKSPVHIEYIDLLLQIFPDAKIVFTHRNPLQTVPSLCRLVQNLLKGSTDEIDGTAIGREWFDWSARGMDRCLESRSRLDASSFLDISYKEIVERPFDAIEKVYSFAGEQLTDSARELMRQWETENPQNKHGAFRYTLEDFGLNEAGIKEAFKEYRERYCM